MEEEYKYIYHLHKEPSEKQLDYIFEVCNEDCFVCWQMGVVVKLSLSTDVPLTKRQLGKVNRMLNTRPIVEAR